MSDEVAPELSPGALPDPGGAGEPAADLVAEAAPAPALPFAPRAPLGDEPLDVLFRAARTQYRWRDEPVPDETLRSLYALLRDGPTSANCSPARFVFVRTAEGKERLRPCLSLGNVERALSAPVVVIVAHDPRFYEELPRLFPHAEAREWFASNYALSEETAFRNGTLQGAYLILAARALGLDCGPMSGFDKAKLDEAFFAESRWQSNFLVNLGHGDPEGLYPRAPRLEFDEACRLA